MVVWKKEQCDTNIEGFAVLALELRVMNSSGSSGLPPLAPLRSTRDHDESPGGSYRDVG